MPCSNDSNGFNRMVHAVRIEGHPTACHETAALQTELALIGSNIDMEYTWGYPPPPPPLSLRRAGSFHCDHATWLAGD